MLIMKWWLRYTSSSVAMSWFHPDGDFFLPHKELAVSQAVERFRGDCEGDPELADRVWEAARATWEAGEKA